MWQEGTQPLTSPRFSDVNVLLEDLPVLHPLLPRLLPMVLLLVLVPAALPSSARVLTVVLLGSRKAAKGPT